MQCTEVQADLSAFIDGELRRDRSRTVADHVAACLGCSEELQSLREVVCWMGGVPEADPPATLHGAILVAVRSTRPTPLQRVLESLRALTPRPTAWAVGLGAAACLALVAAQHRGAGPGVAELVPTGSSSPIRVAVRPQLTVPPQIRELQPRVTATPFERPASAPAHVGGRPRVEVTPVAGARIPRATSAPAPAAPLSAPSLVRSPVQPEAHPAPADVQPARAEDSRSVEPTVPPERTEGGAMVPVNPAGPDAPPPSTMGMMMDTPRGPGTAPGGVVRDDDGLAELRQFLDENKKAGRKAPEPAAPRERAPEPPRPPAPSDEDES